MCGRAGALWRIHAQSLRGDLVVAIADGREHNLAQRLTHRTATAAALAADQHSRPLALMGMGCAPHERDLAQAGLVAPFATRAHPLGRTGPTAPLREAVRRTRFAAAVRRGGPAGMLATHSLRWGWCRRGGARLLGGVGEYSE